MENDFHWSKFIFINKKRIFSLKNVLNILFIFNRKLLINLNRYFIQLFNTILINKHII